MSGSCLVAKLSHYAEIAESDAALLRHLEEEEQPHRKGEVIYAQGDTMRRLFVVKTGWLISSTDMPDGRRQVVRVFQPGDVIGFPDMANPKAQTTLRAVEEGILCPFPYARMSDIFELSPRLTALFFAISLRDQLVIMDLLRANSRMSARERIAHMICEFAARARVTREMKDNVLRLPLQQQEIGDHLGLTNVYVSKTLTALVAERKISRVEGGLKLHDLPGLQEIADFTDRHASLDTRWFPAASAPQAAAGS